MKEEDVGLSKRQILERYPEGSPDYPSHHAGCSCSGCYASWLEWRAGHAAYELGCRRTVEAIVARLRSSELGWEGLWNADDLGDLIQREFGS